MKRSELSSLPLGTRFSIFSRILSLSALLPALLLSNTSQAGQILISEVLVANESAYVPFPSTNPGYTPDYIELFYRATSPDDTTIDLGGWRLASTRDAETNMVFNAGTTMATNSFLLIFLDDRTDLGGIHAGFSIRASRGDLVALTNNFGQLADSVRFGIQVTNYSVGRFPLPGDAMQLNVPTPRLANSGSVAGDPSKLRINEWQPLGDGTKTGRGTNDWIELYNPSSNVVSLAGLVLTDSTSDVVSDAAFEELSFIAPRGYAQIFLMGDDENANDADELEDFSLSSSGGDNIYIYASDRATQYDHVPTAPVPTSSPGRTEGRVPDGTGPITIFANPSPGAPNFGTISEIVINEVLAHTDLPLEDAIELHNITSTNVNIGDWWLTNNPDEPKKFKIPTGTIVPPGGFVVYYEGRKAAVGFNRNGSDISPNFTLNSARGDEVYLYKGLPDNTLTGDRRGLDFGPSQNGVSFGRYITSEGESDIVAMAERTFGQDTPATVAQFRLGTGKINSYPRVGPIVITEMIYDVGTLDEELYEFIELRNISDEVVNLYDPAFPTNRWKLKDGVDFTFPANQSMAPDEYVLVVNFDPSTDTLASNSFRIAFPNIPANTRFFGPYGGSLNNSGDTVELAKPDAPQARGRVDAGLVPYYIIDRVKYNNNAPWPDVENTGYSLQRIVESDYGNDPINWKGTGESPTPGRFNSALGTEPPRITGQPQSQTVRELFNATFTLRTRGGEASYQWTFNGENIEGANSATLEIVGAAPSDAGEYRVILSNAAGSVTSAIATLTVTATPPDTTRPTVAITSPANNARVTTSSVTLKGTATDNTALDRIEYSIGGGSFLTATGRTAWGAQISLEPGTNQIVARAIDTSDNSITSKVHNLIYVVTQPLNLSITGNGTVSGATDDQMLEVGRGYTITAVPATGSVFSNWTGDVSGVSPKLTFLMQSNLSVVANFVPNPFTDVDGKFNGLFYDPNDIQHGSSGFFTLTVTERGSYTASITAGGRKHPASGQLNLEGRATNVIARTGTNALTVEWAVALDDSDRVTGLVSNGDWSAELNGDRAVFNARTSPNTNVGKFTFIMPGTPDATDSPEGDSYGTVALDANGNATVKGFLADKTVISQKVPLSKNGEWPLFASLYSGKGSILGWIGLDDGAAGFSGDINWSKPALATSKYYSNGFNKAYPMTGSRYVAPPVGTRILNLPTGEVILTGGNLAQAQTNAIALGTNNRVTNETPAQKLVFTLVTPSGLFKGNFTPVGATRSIPIAGAVLQNSNSASGYFLGTNQSGRVLLQAPAP